MTVSWAEYTGRVGAGPRTPDRRRPERHGEWTQLALDRANVCGAASFAAAVATLLWRKNEPILGNLAGTGVIFGSALGFILRESVALDRLTRQCLDAGLTLLAAAERILPLRDLRRHRTARSDRAVPGQPHR